MKLDKVRATPPSPRRGWAMDRTVLTDHQDNSGAIERDEFLSLPQISSNPLATRYAASPSTCPPRGA